MTENEAQELIACLMRLEPLRKQLDFIVMKVGYHDPEWDQRWRETQTQYDINYTRAVALLMKAGK